MTSPATFVRLLDAIREHLTTFRLSAPIATVRVASDVLDGDHVTVHLRRLSSQASPRRCWSGSTRSPRPA